MEEFLNALRDIQSINVDKIWPHLSQGSKHSYPDGSGTLSQTSVRALESQTESLRKELEQEKAFKQEYFKWFGKKEIKEVNKMIDFMEDEIKRLREENAKLLEKTKSLEEELRKAITEKDNAMTRFNQQVKLHVTNNTTDISDVCDQTQPNKLGERYKNLYDTLWTVAFEVLTERKRQTEKKAIEMLLKLLIECHNFAIMRADKQMTELVQTISGDPTMQAGDAIILQLKTARKLMNVARADLLFQECEKHVKDKVQYSRVYLYEKEVKMYLIECFQICWLMAIQDPPVVLGKEAKHNDEFDADSYTPYTTSGTKVDFVVWPPLFLHEGGPLLEKGVAYSSKEERETMKTYGNAKNNGTTVGISERPIGRNTDDYPVELSSMTKGPIINDVRLNTNLAQTTIPSSSYLATTSNRYSLTLGHQQSTTAMSQSIPTSYITELVNTSYKQNSQLDYGRLNMATSSIPNANPTYESWNKATLSQHGSSRYAGSTGSMIARESLNKSTEVLSPYASNASTGYEGEMTSQFQNSSDMFENETRGHLSSTRPMYFYYGRGTAYGYKH